LVLWWMRLESLAAPGHDETTDPFDLGVTYDYRFVWELAVMNELEDAKGRQRKRRAGSRDGMWVLV